MNYCENQYFGHLVKGNLKGAISYLSQFPEQKNRLDRLLNRFEKEQFTTYGIEPELEKLLHFYRQYYRDVFYLGMNGTSAEELLCNKLAAHFGITDTKKLGDLEETYVKDAFQKKGYCFLGGRTGGYYGPYIWKHTEVKSYEVELPEGIQEYSVNLLDGFIMKSWLDYLSLGEIGTGGWTDGDGIINCVKASYDLESESFQVSLLKHEAQHARDLYTAPNLPSGDLEYRAKLVELIYSEERPLLRQFLYEAGEAGKDNGHAVAAERIVRDFCAALNQKKETLAALSVEQIQALARVLFDRSQILLEQNAAFRNGIYGGIQ